MAAKTKWNFEAEYITGCNCDWGCPCNFNARPTQGNCLGFGAWQITRGVFGATQLDGVRFADAWYFPKLVEQGNATTRLYIDTAATPEQRQAIEEIHSGRHGGGIFEVFAPLIKTRYPTKLANIDFHFDGAQSWFRVDATIQVTSDTIKYPDGTVITPRLVLPHGIEFKEALATNATNWWMRDEELLGHYENKYCAVAIVKFSEQGCIG